MSTKIERIGNDAAIRSVFRGKCERCLYFMAKCEGITATREWRDSQITITACDGFKSEPLTCQDIQDWRERYGKDAVLPLTKEQLRAGNPKLF